MPMCGDCEIVKAAKKLPPMGGTDDWELRAALARSFRPRKESASSREWEVISRWLSVLGLLCLTSCAPKTTTLRVVPGETDADGCWMVDCNRCCPSADPNVIGCTLLACLEELPPPKEPALPR